MFYEVNVPDPGKDKIAALIVLNPAESRRLIAKAAVALPEVQAGSSSRAASRPRT